MHMYSESAVRREIDVMADEQMDALKALVRGTLRFNEPMSTHTTMQVGGPADVWVQPADLADLQAVLQWAKQAGVPWMIVGRGSNLLVRDGGIRGVVLQLGAMATLRRENAAGEPDAAGTIVYAEAGVRLARLLGFCAEAGLSGVEGLEGVPGTVGGAIVMNAGTPAGVIGDAVVNVTLIEQGERVVTRRAAQLDFGYRKAKISKTATVVATRLQLRAAEPEVVRATLAALRAKREAAQPGHEPAVGSVFRNPDGRSAWSCVEEAGLRGVRIGKARISELHANWIINEGGATARDVETLIRMIRERVKERLGISLETEVVMTGEAD